MHFYFADHKQYFAIKLKTQQGSYMIYSKL
jgi:hypothetical protein